MRKRQKLVMTLDEIIRSKPQSKNRVGAWCLQCDAPSDSEHIVEEHRSPFRQSVHVRVRCHGEEEIGIFEFGTREWDENDLMRAMQRRRWFAPDGGLGNVLNGGRIHG